MSDYSTLFESVLGLIKLSASAKGLTGLLFDAKPDPNSGTIDHPILSDALKQLDEYFQGKRKDFSIPLDVRGTEFQMKVWNAVAKIGYGSIATYQDISKTIKNPKSMRAVGLANGKNPIPIIIPCHRIIGSNGRLTGYGGGLWRKEWLLCHEGSILV
ncbi:MAG TPA: methylated-DNA--[protein]-cysteine S-methyltransferase [Caldithrix sp.]|nr:methylated-DNA--[protein]-cysteine S-methyltransferase [Calditrichaceae bacterium]HEM49049.1 methylated-DNA--[protein]-cysteine S-methyltransferase [Caldithrix sp.]